MLLPVYSLCNRMLSSTFSVMAVIVMFHNESNKCIIPFKVISDFCQDFLSK